MIRRIFQYVEITTKITSIFAFLLSLSYLFYINVPIQWGITILFFFAMFVFDLTTTAINNYIDTKTNDQILPFRRPIALIILFTLLASSIALGLWLAYLTDIIVLMLGIFCFFIGIIYTFGPVPISRQPYGELFSGIFYGFMIPFFILYINQPNDTYITLAIDADRMNLSLNIRPTFDLLLLSVAPVCTTANIMLANNICDVEKDIQVKRYTLPYYLGQHSLHLFAWLYYVIYLAAVLLVLLEILHPISLAIFLTLPLVHSRIQIFKKEQTKKRTFIMSIQNYLIIMGASTLLIFLAGLLARM